MARYSNIHSAFFWGIGDEQLDQIVNMLHDILPDANTEESINIDDGYLSEQITIEDLPKYLKKIKNIGGKVRSIEVNRALHNKGYLKSVGVRLVWFDGTFLFMRHASAYVYSYYKDNRYKENCRNWGKSADQDLGKGLKKILHRFPNGEWRIDTFRHIHVNQDKYLAIKRLVSILVPLAVIITTLFTIFLYFKKK